MKPTRVFLSVTTVPYRQPAGRDPFTHRETRPLRHRASWYARGTSTEMYQSKIVPTQEEAVRLARAYLERQKGAWVDTTDQPERYGYSHSSHSEHARKKKAAPDPVRDMVYRDISTYSTPQEIEADLQLARSTLEDANLLLSTVLFRKIGDLERAKQVMQQRVEPQHARKKITAQIDRSLEVLGASGLPEITVRVVPVDGKFRAELTTSIGRVVARSRLYDHEDTAQYFGDNMYIMGNWRKREREQRL